MSSRLTTDLNSAPYFDATEQELEKNYHKVVFKPGVAVQARELSGLQGILQEQISRHGDYVFKDGSIVEGCAITYIPKYPVVYLENQFTSNTSLTVDDIPSTYLLVSNTGVRAVVSHSETGYELSYPNTNRFYVNYIRTGTSGSTDVSEFQSGETIYIYNENQSKFGTLQSNNLVDSISVLTSNATANATGTAYGISVTDGIIYQKGYFINVDAHSIPVRMHDTNVEGYVVGFDTEESIVTYRTDSSLLSNAQGFENQNAPGADRLKLTATLVSKSKSDIANNTNFFSIVEFDANTPTQQATGEASLNKVLDVLASRTEEESGTYVVKPFTIDTYANTANSEKFNYEISPGIIYVNGYRVEKLNTFLVPADRAKEIEIAQNQIVTANLGQYIKLQEVVGSLDFDHLDEIVIYDAPQTSITDIEGSDTAPAGNIVGYATAVSLVYASGIKGTGTDIHNLYLLNIRMNSGKNFSTDAKSVYATSGFGSFKGDIILESGSAHLYNVNSRLVYPFGNEALKTLRGASGNNDTSFVFRDTSSATISANGSVTFTINPAYNGGVERLNYSVGALTQSLGDTFNIKTGAELYSANLSGSVAITSGNATIVGTGTAFTTDFSVGSIIRFNVTGTFYTRKVQSIANNTQLVLSSAISAANTAAKYQLYYPQGSTIDVYKKGSISVLSNTQFRVDTGITIASGTQTTYADYDVYRTSAIEAKKEIKKNCFVKINCSNNTATSVGPWDLGFVDIAKIRNVYVGTTYSTSNPDRKEWFTFSNGQTDSMYDHGKLIIKNAYKSKLSSSSKILIELDYFTANTTSGVGFFSVDSYPIDDANTANTLAITTAEIPKYYSSISDSFIDLRNCVDFRPRKYNTASYSANVSSASINPVASNTSFDTPASGSYIISPDTNFTADIQYYLPRIDLLLINEAGDFIAKSGVASLNPIAPTYENDTALVARAYVKPYPSLTVEEAETYSRSDLLTSIKSETVPVYTMKDIQKLDQRIERLEYYVTLNMLEQKAKNTIVTDESGLDRFKNGIFADNFNDHSLGQTSDIEYSISIDKLNGYARPKFKVHSIDMQYDSSLSSGVTRTGNLVTLPYINELFIDQKYATNVRNCAGSVWKWNGKVSLYPAYDYYNSSVSLPATQVTLDLSNDSAKSTDIYGDWRVLDSDTSVSRSTSFNGSRTSVTTTTTTTTTSEQIVTTIVPSTKSASATVGGLTVTSTNTYMRSRIVAFVASGLKPNTIMNIFFDNELVNQYCAPGVLSGSSSVVEGRENEIVTQTSAYGTTIRSTADGNVYGLFKIPENTFKTGNRELIITDVTDLYEDSDNVLTRAAAIYDATSTTTTSGGATELTALTTIYNTSSATNTKTTSSSTSSTSVQTSLDPIAQSFTMVLPDMNLSGGFVSRIGLFFKSKDANLGIDVYLAKTTVGYPDSSILLGKASLEAGDVLTSADASVETIFTFDNPVYLKNNEEYAFIVKPRGDSPEYNIWISRTGNYDVYTGEQVYKDPYTGVLFVSANMAAWTAIQAENIKFKMYRSKFSTSAGTLTLTNEDDEYLKIDGFTKANSSYNVEVGDRIVAVVSGSRITNTANSQYVTGIVQSYDDAEDSLVIDSSNGRLNIGTVLEVHRSATPSNSASFNANTLIANCTITEILNKKYSVVAPNFSIVTPMYTSVETYNSGTDVLYGFDSGYSLVQNQYDTEFIDKERLVLSKSNERINTAGTKTLNSRLILATANEYVSPVVDLRQKQVNLIENIINNDVTNEYTRYGSALSKSVSKTITLDTTLGASEDIKAYIGAWRPFGTDIKVYVKLLGQYDNEPFADKLWTELPMVSGSSSYSSSNIQDDFREYEFGMPTAIQATVGSKTTAYLNANGVSTYSRSDGALISGFVTYAFKIVLLADSTALVPKINDFRSLALMA